MTAKEMFEKLGYLRQIKHSFYEKEDIKQMI